MTAGRRHALIRSGSRHGSIARCPIDAHELADLLERQAGSDRAYLEFIRVADLSVGLYVLPAGGVDRQVPHAEDEVYHVLAGEARLTVGDEIRPMGPGTTVYVAAHVPHRFHDISSELRLLVFFAPPESPPPAGSITGHRGRPRRS